LLFIIGNPSGIYSHNWLQNNREYYLLRLSSPWGEVHRKYMWF
jgi:hypothetical protein